MGKYYQCIMYILILIWKHISINRQNQTGWRSGYWFNCIRHNNQVRQIGKLGDVRSRFDYYSDLAGSDRSARNHRKYLIIIFRFQPVSNRSIGSSCNNSLCRIFFLYYVIIPKLYQFILLLELTFEILTTHTIVCFSLFNFSFDMNWVLALFEISIDFLRVEFWVRF